MILKYYNYISESTKKEIYTLYLLEDFTSFLKSAMFVGNNIADRLLNDRLTITEKINYINISDS